MLRAELTEEALEFLSFLFYKSTNNTSCKEWQQICITKIYKCYLLLFLRKKTKGYFCFLFSVFFYLQAACYIKL